MHSRRYESYDFSFVAGQFSYSSTASSYVPSHGSFTAGTAQNHSPLIPPSALYPGSPSPYAPNVPLPGASPYRGSVPFPPASGDGSTNGWVPPDERRHPGNFAAASDYSFPNSPLGGGRQQTSSYNIYQQVQMNPWLTGYVQAGLGYLWFDFSMAAFNPIRVDNMGIQVPLGMNELNSPATYPHIQYMTVICDAMPCLPITGIGDGSRWLSLGDVLQGLYRMMMWRISREEWQSFPESDKAAIAKAFTRRCRARWNPQLVRAERQDGVKRVDLLLGKTMFRGLIVEGGVFKLILS
ncbi:uncharacterized protein EV420DRAFT_1312806 [Desarmillaria tabescens]|uniref:DUF6699 domain-containing protein n=1 Tax=Armillaria tabescens TaxID=1929756 RepID=A0AA39MXN5_ARMTA|nr:uncharacterized protein EV420DRAFT_1312806 [Desarmillaria tabescens]KAK0449660.1 hypothetical protein EV420DRAFT_1312806 [Desarmillaria tabescens]